MRVIWTTRRLFCDNDQCSRKIFAEQCPKVAAPHSRRTDRLRQITRALGIACGGELGRKLANRLGVLTSADTLLRDVRGMTATRDHKPSVIGIDEWAYRKGDRYGTLICDLETGQVVDLLPDRDANSVAAWLKRNPTVRILSRDRSEVCRRGASLGGSTITQVVDRFHLMKNLREAFGRYLEGHASELHSAAEKPTEADSTANAAGLQQPTVRGTTKKDLRKSENRRRRLSVFEQVHRLHKQGVSERAIARQCGICRNTVRQYLRSNIFPERAVRRYSSTADSVKDELRQRWNNGCRNLTALWREVQERGFQGSYHAVRRMVRHWRQSDNGSNHWAVRHPRGLSATRVSFLLLKEAGTLADKETKWKRAILRHCPNVRTAWRIVDQFATMLRTRQGERLQRWFEAATRKTVPTAIRRFALGLRKDWQAVTAALTTPWSNGMAEGHIGRLKMIKRLMYGRAKFDLLRARCLAAI